MKLKWTVVDPHSGLKEDAPANMAGSGNIAGIGVGPQGEPGIRRKKKKEDPTKAIRRARRGSRGGLNRLVRCSLEVLWELLEVQEAPQATILDTFIVFRASKRAPGGPQVTIYRPCRRFRASGRRTTELRFRLSRTWAGPGRTPGHARARASFHYYSFVSNLNADAPSSPEGRRIASPSGHPPTLP